MGKSDKYVVVSAYDSEAFRIDVAHAAIDHYGANQAYIHDVMHHRPTHASRQRVNDLKSDLDRSIKDHLERFPKV